MKADKSSIANEKIYIKICSRSTYIDWLFWSTTVYLFCYRRANEIATHLEV